MLTAKYTIRGLDIVDVNPELVTGLERISSPLYQVSVSLPDFNYYEEAVEMMHGKHVGKGIAPEGPWARARFRFDGKTRINSLQGILFSPFSGDDQYIQLAQKIPGNLGSCKVSRYDSNELWCLNERSVKGASADLMVVDAGVEHDTLKIGLDDGTVMKFFYAPGTFIGFQISESTGHGITYEHFILSGVDPSVYVPGFLQSTHEKDAVFNEGLCGKIKPLVEGAAISYRQPKREQVELIRAEKGDQYLVLLEAETPEAAQNISGLFRGAWEVDTKLHPDAQSIVDRTNERSGGNFSGVGMPQFSVSLAKDRKPDSHYYGLTLTTLSTGDFKTQNDIRDLVRGYVKGLRPEIGSTYIEVI